MEITAYPTLMKAAATCYLLLRSSQVSSQGPRLDEKNISIQLNSPADISRHWSMIYDENHIGKSIEKFLHKNSFLDDLNKLYIHVHPQTRPLLFAT